MQVRMLKPLNALKAGSIATVGGGVAELWISRGVAERMVPEQPAVETNKRPKRSGHNHSRKRVHA